MSAGALELLDNELHEWMSATANEDLLAILGGGDEFVGLTFCLVHFGHGGSVVDINASEVVQFAGMREAALE